MIKGLNHVGISVIDLERSIEFYCKGLGMEVLSRSTFQPGLYDGKYEHILGLPGATGRVAMVGLVGNAGALRLEMFEFSAPTPKHRDPRYPVSDHGISHFCVEVSGIESEYQRLEAAGATFHCPPLTFFGGKAKALYARDPDGNVFELLERD